MTNLLFKATPSTILLAAQKLQNGGLVAFPTETVYGLGADATNDSAVARIFLAKGRPQFNPIIVHYDDLKQADEDVVFSKESILLASIFWPGPLTLILPRKPGTTLSLLTSAGLSTQGVRCPAHPVARQLIRDLGRPIAAPSANTSGTLSPTTAQHVLHSLAERAEMILAGGKSAVGLESTVIDMTSAIPTLLRPGAITAEDIESCLGIPIHISYEISINAPKSPGQLLRHYAPHTPLRLRAIDVDSQEGLLAFGSTRFMSIKSGGYAKQLPAHQYRNLSDSGDLNEAASNLFRMLHELDQQKLNGIAVMDIPEKGLGIAINDRLRRATQAQTAPLSQKGCHVIS